MSIVSRLRSLRGDGSTETEPDPDLDESGESEAGRSDSSLFQCPECETVYIAIEMERCSQCAVDVEPIGSSEPVLLEPE